MDYQIGDVDDTQHILDWENCCDLIDDEWGFICTREPDHHGNHAAGTGHEIVHVW